MTPIEPTPAPVTLGYASGKDYQRDGQSGFAVGSLVLCGTTVLYCVVCFVGMTRARGWDGLGWLVVGLIGNWVGCGLAAILALVGVVQRRRRRQLAVHALWISLVLGLGPIGIIGLVEVL